MSVRNANAARPAHIFYTDNISFLICERGEAFRIMLCSGHHEPCDRKNPHATTCLQKCHPYLCASTSLLQQTDCDENAAHADATARVHASACTAHVSGSGAANIVKYCTFHSMACGRLRCRTCHISTHARVHTHTHISYGAVVLGIQMNCGGKHLGVRVLVVRSAVHSDRISICSATVHAHQAYVVRRRASRSPALPSSSQSYAAVFGPTRLLVLALRIYTFITLQ